MFESSARLSGLDAVQLAEAITDNQAELRRAECRVLELACAWADADQWGVLLVNKDTKPHTLVLHSSRPATSEAFALSMKVFTIVDGRPYEAQTTGPREGEWRTELPPMSVIFVAAPRKGDASRQ